MPPTPDRRRLILSAAAAFTGLAARKLPGRTPMFTKTGLAELPAVMERSVAGGYAPGMVGLVDRAGETHAFVTGTTAFGGPTPMRRDTIFRITSMTKPITAAAAMMLVDEGKLRLDEPVDRLLPELANRRVLPRLEAPLSEAAPALRPITVEDLLTFRLGWGIIMAPPGTYPIQKAIADLQLVGFGPPDPNAPYDADEFLRRLGTLPLLAQPGVEWHYTTGSDVLGVLVARVAGQTLGRVLHDRVFAPLGMTDTAFFVPADKLGRFAPQYGGGSGGVGVSDPVDGAWSRPPRFEQGDAGLVSTADDYLAFARFLQSGTTADGRRLISPASLAAMKTNHITPAQAAANTLFLGPGAGWGYGMSVVTGPHPQGFGLGTYSWFGGFGTSWITDPTKDLTVLLMTQRGFDGPTAPAVHKAFQAAAYAALA